MMFLLQFLLNISLSTLGFLSRMNKALLPFDIFYAAVLDETSSNSNFLSMFWMGILIKTLSAFDHNFHCKLFMLPGFVAFKRV